MGPWLLDINVLVGLLWPYHSSHRRVRQWFDLHRAEGWATSPITETGFLRVVTNPAFTPNNPQVADAVAMLAASKQSSLGHRFWPDDLSAEVAVERFGKRVIGHKQIPDAYLLALAIHHQGKLVTFDRRMTQLAPDGSTDGAFLEVL